MSDPENPGMVTQMRSRLAASKDDADAKRKAAADERAKKAAERAAGAAKAKAAKEAAVDEAAVGGPAVGGPAVDEAAVGEDRAPGMVTQMRDRLAATKDAAEAKKKAAAEEKAKKADAAKAAPKADTAKPAAPPSKSSPAADDDDDKAPGMVTQMRSRLAAKKEDADAKRKAADDSRAEKAETAAKDRAAKAQQAAQAAAAKEAATVEKAPDVEDEKDPGVMTQMRARLNKAKAGAEEKAAESKERAAAAAVKRAEDLAAKKKQLAESLAPPAAPQPAAANSPVAAAPAARPAPARPVAMGGRGAEPATAMKNVLDIPLKFSLSPEWTQTFDTFTQKVYAHAQDDNWLPTYDEALALVERLGDDVGQKLDEKQVEILEMTEPAEIKNRLSADPRKKAEAIKADVKTRTAKEAKEWSERSKRQLDFIITSCSQICAEQLLVDGSDALEQTKITGGLKLEVSDAWWKSYQDYVATCCEDWTKNFTGGSEKSIAKAVVEGMHASTSFAPLQAMSAVEDSPFVASDLYLNDIPPPTQSGKVPNVVAAGFQAMRQNLMMIGMMALMLIAPVATFFFDTKVDRKLITLFFIVPVLGYSFFKARTERAELLEKLLTSQKDAVATFMKSQLTKALERHRQNLEKWMATRVEAHIEGSNQYFAQHIEPILVDGDDKAAVALRAQKIEQQKANEELGTLRTFRNQLAQQLSLELKKHRRDLLRKQGG